MASYIKNFKFKSILPFLFVFILAACCGGGGGSGGAYVGEVVGSIAANTAPTILGAYSNTQVACCYFEPNNDYFSQEGITSIFTVSASDAEGDSIVFSLSGGEGYPPQSLAQSLDNSPGSLTHSC